MKVTFRGGVHPPHDTKLATKSVAIRDFTADRVKILMNMNIGAPSNPCVQAGDHVLMGQVIGEPVGPLGVNVHASVSGTVESVEAIDYIGGMKPTCVTIINDHKDAWVELHPLGDVETVDAEQIIPAIKAAGIVGMGGASFPTHVKMALRPDQRCDYIIANGAECETHLSCDHRLMLEESEWVVNGLRAAMRALDVKQGVIAIEDNKPDAIEAMERACKGRDGVRVQVMDTKYPQGGEKQLINAVTGRQVPTACLPIYVGTVVLNVSTCAAIADAIVLGKPLVERLTTVTGCVKNPSNLRMRVGTLAADAINACGGTTAEAAKVVFGGMMTGLTLPHLETPTAKATNGIVVLDARQAREAEESDCIRCGRCADACPIGLKPYLIRAAADAKDYASCQDAHIMDCVLCGCCSYVCPAHRKLTQNFKSTKGEIAALARKAGAGK